MNSAVCCSGVSSVEIVGRRGVVISLRSCVDALALSAGGQSVSSIGSGMNGLNAR